MTYQNLHHCASRRYRQRDWPGISESQRRRLCRIVPVAPGSAARVRLLDRRLVVADEVVAVDRAVAVEVAMRQHVEPVLARRRVVERGGGDGAGRVGAGAGDDDVAAASGALRRTHLELLPRRRQRAQRLGARRGRRRERRGLAGAGRQVAAVLDRVLLLAHDELGEERTYLGVALGLAVVGREARQRDRREDRDEGDDDHQLEESESGLLATLAAHAAIIHLRRLTHEIAAGASIGSDRIASYCGKRAGGSPGPP